MFINYRLLGYGHRIITCHWWPRLAPIISIQSQISDTSMPFPILSHTIKPSEPFYGIITYRSISNIDSYYFLPCFPPSSTLLVYFFFERILTYLCDGDTKNHYPVTQCFSTYFYDITPLLRKIFRNAFVFLHVFYFASLRFLFTAVQVKILQIRLWPGILFEIGFSFWLIWQCKYSEE